MVYLLYALKLVLGEHRGRQLQHGAVVRVLGKQISVVPDIYGTVGLANFPQRVDRRVRHLGEALFEVIEQKRVRF